MTQFDLNSNTSDYIAVDDAVFEFALSRSTIFRMIKDRTLHKYRRGADRKTYVLRSELDRIQAFREVGNSYDASPPGRPDPVLQKVCRPVGHTIK